jgi:hypothetical protein
MIYQICIKTDVVGFKHIEIVRHEVRYDIIFVYRHGPNAEFRYQSFSPKLTMIFVIIRHESIHPLHDTGSACKYHMFKNLTKERPTFHHNHRTAKKVMHGQVGRL